MRTRREVLAAASGLGAAVAAGSPPTRAQAPRKLTVIAHAVHRQAATTGPGGDITAAWRQANGGVEIEWLTFGVEAVNERALLEANLAQPNVDVVFLLDRYTGPQYAGLFDDIREWNGRQPVPAFDEIPAGMLAAHSFNGKLTAMPYRHATQGLHYNAELFAERGVAGPPAKIEDVAAVAERLTYTRSDGTRVFGLVMVMEDPAAPMDWIRAHGGDFITPEYRVVVDRPEAVAGVAMLRELVQKGAIPRNVMNLKNEDVNTYMQQGRAAMSNNPFGRYTVNNDQRASKFPGKIQVVPLPAAVGGGATPAKTSVWAMAIPRNGRNKELAWSLVRHLSTPEATVLATLNGNGPVRPSAYSDPRVTALFPYAAAEQQALATARLVVPSFANAARAMDVFMEELGLALIGQKTAQGAMGDVRRRVEPLLPT